MTCIGCSRGFDRSNKTFPTGWSSHPLVACHRSLPALWVRNRLLMAGKLVKHQPSRLPLDGGGRPRKPQAGLLETESRLRLPRAGELGQGRDLHPSALPNRDMSPTCCTDRAGRRYQCTQLQFQPLADPCDIELFVEMYRSPGCHDRGSSAMASRQSQGGIWEYSTSIVNPYRARILFINMRKYGPVFGPTITLRINPRRLHFI
jgi:hypothetical protein